MIYNRSMLNTPTNSAKMHTSLSTIISNKRRVSALKSLGIVTVEDALTYYPFRVTSPLRIANLKDVKIGEEVAFYAQVQSINVVPMNARRGFRIEINVLQDMQAVAQLIYFSKNRQYAQWLSAKMHVGEMVVVGGTSSAFNGKLQFTHPQILTVSAVEESDSLHQSRDTVRSVEDGLARMSAPMPVYHANSRISSEHIHETILSILSALSKDSKDSEDFAASADSKNSAVCTTESLQIPNITPESVLKKRNLMTRASAIYSIHNPQSVDEFYKAVDSLRYEEAFISQVAVLRSREDSKDNQAKSCNNSLIRNEFVESLPFELTAGQKDVIDEIVRDMRERHPMRRLLQGEVGSGKTVVALAAMLEAVGSGYQAVLVAPTQVLASQHAENLRQMIARANLKVPVIVVTGGMRLADRRRALASVASGEPSLIVATHAAFSSTFKPTNLALVIIDEQHRFGVEQRDVLLRKMSVDPHDSAEKSFTPHLLVMTATPIPRSAAMTWFGDLDASYLTELPGGRKPIRTFVVQESDANTMARMFAHIRARIDAGERAYVVCAHIDDDFNEDSGRDSASGSASGSARDFDSDESEGFEDVSQSVQSNQFEENSADSLRKLHTVNGILKRLSALPQFKGVTFAKLTGRDDDATKRETMEHFARGDVQVLVATTVIEVGVDVPQASCIVIFDADRFGLAQLHQLRGRVGRGGTNSWAFLVAQTEDGSLAQERLQVVENSLDGAIIAKKDLELRNVGDVLGDKQSGGRSSLKILRVVKDAKIIAMAREDALETLQKDAHLVSLPYLAGAVLDFTRGGSTQIVSN
ncbi:MULTISPECIES: ATP-dependent DNA helicase RecG [Gardnerella]|uniref:Probable DNA 3'-5' helicase RecG n=1 Tax=Gardnerella vaginalis TaxID=2702 RepID=A0AAP8LS17_GARVA|nr:ATP-dependent DNA helicase RecG [Gardnerella sp. 30-4]PKZ59663.1 ATP-dependent DNA helicase RecG [Gardnerella vaginalis]RFT32021.1 ATP-dependent DNA helicase RecG [Bifidobacteriaceae bacterium VN003]